jgi:hypothetical protein
MRSASLCFRFRLAIARASASASAASRRGAPLKSWLASSSATSSRSRYLALREKQAGNEKMRCFTA